MKTHNSEMYFSWESFRNTRLRSLDQWKNQGMSDAWCSGQICTKPEQFDHNWSVILKKGVYWFHHIWTLVYFSIMFEYISYSIPLRHSFFVSALRSLLLAVDKSSRVRSRDEPSQRSQELRKVASQRLGLVREDHEERHTPLMRKQLRKIDKEPE